MIAIPDVERCLQKRVILTNDSNVSYVGVAQDILPLQEKQGVVVRLDARSGFAIWCPLDFVKRLVVVPIAEEA